MFHGVLENPGFSSIFAGVTGRIAGWQLFRKVCKNFCSGRYMIRRSWSVVLCYMLCPDRDYCTVGS